MKIKELLQLIPNSARIIIMNEGEELYKGFVGCLRCEMIPEAAVSKVRISDETFIKDKNFKRLLVTHKYKDDISELELKDALIKSYIYIDIKKEE